MGFPPFEYELRADEPKDTAESRTLSLLRLRVGRAASWNVRLVDLRVVESKPGVARSSSSIVAGLT